MILATGFLHASLQYSRMPDEFQAGRIDEEELLARFLAGEATDAERAEIQRRLAADGRITVERPYNAAAYLGWAEDRLFYRRAPLARVAADLERWYDVEIEIPDDDLAAQRVTLDLRARKLEGVLDTVAAQLRLHYERHDDSIVFRP